MHDMQRLPYQCYHQEVTMFHQGAGTCFQSRKVCSTTTHLKCPIDVMADVRNLQQEIIRLSAILLCLKLIE